VKQIFTFIIGAIGFVLIPILIIPIMVGVAIYETGEDMIAFLKRDV